LGFSWTHGAKLYQTRRGQSEQEENLGKESQGNGALGGLRKREEETKIRTPPTEPLESPRETLVPRRTFFPTMIFLILV